MKGCLKAVTSMLLVMLLSFLGFGLWSMLWPEPAHAAVYTVTLTTDTLPLGAPGELRWAINAANATPGVPDNISFAIPAPGVQSILPLAPLPAIIDTVTIDGYTQGGTPPGAGTPAVILVELDGSLAGAADGLTFQMAGANGSLVRGLAVNRFSQNGIFLQGAINVTVEANNIGTDVLGAVPLPNGWQGVYVFGGASGNTIGGPAAGNRNVISGNLAYGVSIDNAPGNLVTGNYIGTDMNGAAPLPNSLSGVAVVNNSSGNFIGAAGQGNVISGNINDGVYVTGSAGNGIQGNYIGTDSSGTAALPNQSHGVFLINAANANTVGGSAPGQGNVISGNLKFGVIVDNSNSVNVQGNYIGTDAAGTAALPNGGSGIFLNNNATGNTIGGATAGHRNLISGNINSGIVAQLSSTGNFVQGNYVGTDVNGTAALGNAMYGIQLIAGANSNTVGGSNPGEGNLVSGNVWDGVNIDSSTGNAVQGNYIGLDAGGNTSLGNSGNGIHLLNGASSNTVGGITAGHRNVISGNSLHGVYMNGAGGNFLQGNYIGLDAAGSVSRGNSSDGVNVAGGSNGNTVGGTTPGHRNVISGNGVEGVQVDNSTGNTISANYVGLDAGGSISRGNGGTGVALTNGANSTTVGGLTAAERNVISANFYGLHVQASTGCTVYGNYIGTDVSGTLARGNQNRGVYIQGANANILGGTFAAQRNVISGNGHTGVLIENSSGTTFQGNYIGTDASGTASVGNVTYGVWMYNNPGPNTIGGTAAGAGNLVSGNNHIGVFLDNSLGQALEGNYVGTDATGASALGNASVGVYLQHSAAGNNIGGGTPAHRNVISGNGSHGIEIDDPDGNTVYGNYIGTDAAGTSALGNTGDGIYLLNGANGNAVGGANPGEGNIISGNTGNGVEIDGSTGNTIYGNYIGTDVAGNAAVPNSQGVYINNSANSNTIGGNTAGHRNVISGNASDGVEIDGSTGNFIYGNYVGTNAAGAAALANGANGVYFLNGANNNTVGGATAGQGNLVSGNASDGVEIDGSTGSFIYGNHIGTNAAGTSAIPNGNHGVYLLNGVNGTTIGGASASQRNVISGNTRRGIRIDNGNANSIKGNYVGVDASGAAALGNLEDGIYVMNGGSVTIGGGAAGEGNVISGNGADGIEIDASPGNTIQGNRIGTNAAGTADLGNAVNGIHFWNCYSSTIGGSTAGQGNLVSGNNANGIQLNNYSYSNGIRGNYVGTDVNGTTGLGNGQRGIYVYDISNTNTIGGTTTAERNLISGNTGSGIEMDGSTGSFIRGNYVGTNWNGTAALANGSNGVYLRNAANTNTIGGTTAGERNVISGNNGMGVNIDSSGSNTISGNYIGTDASGASAVTNLTYGVYLLNGATGNTIGGSAVGAGNLISGNSQYGVAINASTANALRGNYVGINAAGNAQLPNGSTGVYLYNNADSNTIGGNTAGHRNVISYNYGAGVWIDGCDNCTISGNYVGTNAAGTAALGNGSGVMVTAGATGNTIGGSTAAEGNLLSGNAYQGVYIASSSGNSVKGNLIGTNAAGTGPLGNAQDGIWLNSANANAIGGTTAGERNVVSCSSWRGVRLSDSDTNTISGNYIGSNTAGTGILANAGDGVYLEAGSDNNTIGSTAAGGRNVIGGNIGNGVLISGSTGNGVYGNYVGLDVTGAVGLSNYQNGIVLTGGASGNTIGGTTAGHRNVIGANSGQGVLVNGATGNFIQGNHIGTNAAGTASLPNTSNGVSMVGAADNNTIGGTTAGHRNVISGNGSNGVAIDGSTGNTVSGNYVGTDVSGTAALANGWNGVYLTNASGNTVGGATAGHRNLISGNGHDGVHIDSSTGNAVRGNYIGTGADGATAVANWGDGIDVVLSANNTIGGAASGERNVVSGNLNHGVNLFNSTGNYVRGNYVGTDLNGTSAVPNGSMGVYLVNYSDGNTIGGGGAGEGNLVSGNTYDGIVIYNSRSNVVQGNRVGTDAAGASAVPNGDSGIYLIGIAGTPGNTIGGSGAGEGNLVSGNLNAGIRFNDADGNVLRGNRVGTDVSGASALPNGNGLYLHDNTDLNTIGGSAAGEGNLISGNASEGVKISNATRNVFEGNRVGTDAAGTSSLPNSVGIFIDAAANDNVIGGAAAGQGNLISGNNTHGVIIYASTGNVLQGNYVGADAAGTGALANAADGIYLASAADSNTIGGTAAGANLIANNGSDGVSIDGSSSCEVSYNQVLNNTSAGVVVSGAASVRDKISRNSIYGNGALGIDLVGGANHDYAAPVFSGTELPVVSGTTYVSGTAPANAHIEFYYTGAVPDPSGHGEGLTYLGTVDADGSGGFSTTLAGPADGDWLSATATSPAGDPLDEGNTSEFSLNAQVSTGYSVDASVTGGNGDVDPDSQIVIDGRDATIDLLPDAHYHAATITDNGSPATVADPYVISNVTAAHTVVVTYAIDTFAVNASVTGGGGTVDPATQDIAYGSPASIDLQPEDGYHVDTITDNGAPQAVEDPYVIDPVTETHDVVVTFARDVQTWYLAEGCTGGDFETWVLVQNPGENPVTVDLTFMTSAGMVPGPQDFAVPAGTRYSFNANSYVTDWDVSTRVDAAGGDVICERAMYGGGRAWAHDSIGTTTPAPVWYLAEGCTGGDFETWALVQNPGEGPVTVDLTFMTSAGEVPGPQDYLIPAGTRHSFNVNSYVLDWDVSTRVEASGDVVCERAMYGNGRTWAHDSIGVTDPDTTWYLAEGCTGGDFETFVLVQNPGAAPVTVDLSLMTSTGEVPGPQDFAIPAGTRHTFKINDYVTDWDVSTRVTAVGGDVICERAVYGNLRAWAHDSIGTTTPAPVWYLAEGCTGGDFETFVLVQNPGTTPVYVDLTFMTSSGEVPGPQDYLIPGGTRHTFKVNDYVTDWDVSTRVEASGDVICERAMYGNGRTWAHDSIGYAP